MFNELLKNVMNLGIITADDVKRLTTLELMMLIIERTNGLLNHVEIIDEKLVNLLENIRTTTIEELNKWKQDGTLDVLINQTLLKEVNAQLTECLSEIDSLNEYSSNLGVNVNDVESLKIAMQSKQKVTLKYGTYQLTEPLTLLSGTTLQGFCPFEDEKELHTRIVLSGNHAFSSLTPESRIFINLKDIAFIGTGVEKVIAFPFGGRIEGCTFKNLDIAIENTNSYLTQFINCTFINCNIGVKLGVANSILFDSCYFNKNIIGVDSGSDATAFKLTNCACNMNNNSQIAFKLNGGVIVDSCYFEGFGLPCPSSCYIDYTASKFGYKYLKIEGCDFDGSELIANAIRIGLEQASSGYISGKITLNRFARFTGDTVLYKENNEIDGIEIVNNNGDVTIGNKTVEIDYMPKTCSLIGSAGVSASSYTKLPLAKTIIYDNVNAFSTVEGSYRVRKSGVYRIKATINQKATTSMRVAEARIINNGTVIGTTITSSINVMSGGDNYDVLELEYIAPLTKGDTVDVQVRNGELIEGGIFICEYLSEN